MSTVLLAAIVVLAGSVLAGKMRRRTFWIWALFHLAAIVSAAVAGYAGGLLIVQMRYIHLPKERRLIAQGMHRMETLIHEGNTNAILSAVQAFNRTVEGNMNRERSYEAAVKMIIALNADANQRGVGGSP